MCKLMLSVFGRVCKFSETCSNFCNILQLLYVKKSCIAVSALQFKNFMASRQRKIFFFGILNTTRIQSWQHHLVYSPIVVPQWFDIRITFKIGCSLFGLLCHTLGPVFSDLTHIYCINMAGDVMPELQMVLIHSEIGC